MLLRPIRADDKVEMRRLYSERGYDLPIEQRVTSFHTALQQSSADWKPKLVKKWLPRLALARTKKSPGNTGLRTEHLRPFYVADITSWSVIAEASEHHLYPTKTKVIYATISAASLLKRDASGRYSTKSGLRPIGKLERPLADFGRPSASRCAKVLGAYLAYAHSSYACGLKSGGEAVSTGLQLRISTTWGRITRADGTTIRTQTTVTLLTDCSNAFCRADNELCTKAIEALQDEVRELMAAGGPALKHMVNVVGFDAAEIIAAAGLALDDIVYFRTFLGAATINLDGRLLRETIDAGETQGGLFSMPRFSVLFAIRVIRILKREFPEVTWRNIADDATGQLTVDTPEALAVIPRLLVRFDKLMSGDPDDEDDEGAKMKPNFAKFVLLQHRDFIGTDLDVANILGECPVDRETGQPPKIKRACSNNNGIPIGFDDAISIQERVDGCRHSASILREETIVMREFLPLVGPQRIEILGRMCYVAGSVLMHLARNAEPSITQAALVDAHDAQVDLLRAITCCGEEHMPTRQFQYATAPETDRCVPTLAHLLKRHGGFGWRCLYLVSAQCSAARIIDVLPHLRNMADLRDLIPPPRTWKTCGIPMFEDAMAAIEDVVHTAAFQKGPEVYKEAWSYVYKRLWVNDAFNPDGIEELAARHTQHVFCEAMSQQLRDDLLNDASLPRETRGHLRSCGRPVSSAWLGNRIGDDTSLLKETFWVAAMRRLNHPISAIMPHTRCIGSAKRCQLYTARNMLTNPPCMIGAGEVQRPLSVREHEDAAHFDSCPGGGHLTMGHNAVTEIYTRHGLAKLGFSCVVKEEYVGRGPPTRQNPHGVNQRVDALAFNMTAFGGRALAIDATVGSARLHSNLNGQAGDGAFTTRKLEDSKKKSKQPPCARRNMVYLTVAMDANSALGEAAWDIVNEGWKAKAAALLTDRDKWAVMHEKANFCQLLSVAVQRSRASILFCNARPIATGFKPPATFDIDEHGDPMEFDY